MPASPLPDAVLLDMDGTIADSEQWWFRAETELLARYGVTWTEKLAEAVVGCSISWWAEKMVGDFDLPVLPGVLERNLVDMVRSIALVEDPKWRPGARELLELLASLRIPAAVVTSSPEAIARAVLRQAPEGALRAFVTADAGLPGKPQPDPYLHAARLLGAKPSRCVAFEDSLFGVRSALAARTHAVVVPYIVPIPDMPGLIRIASLGEVDAQALARFMGEPLPDGDPLAFEDRGGDE